MWGCVLLFGVLICMLCMHEVTAQTATANEILGVRTEETED